MDSVIIEYVSSAFKHGLTKTNIQYAMRQCIYDELFDDELKKRLLIRFDDNANLLEIMYNDIDEQTVRVFHAMKCRNIFRPLIYNLMGGDYA